MYPCVCMYVSCVNQMLARAWMDAFNMDMVAYLGMYEQHLAAVAPHKPNMPAAIYGVLQ